MEILNFSKPVRSRDSTAYTNLSASGYSRQQQQLHRVNQVRHVSSNLTSTKLTLIKIHYETVLSGKIWQKTIFLVQYWNSSADKILWIKILIQLFKRDIISRADISLSNIICSVKKTGYVHPSSCGSVILSADRTSPSDVKSILWASLVLL